MKKKLHEVLFSLLRVVSLHFNAVKMPSEQDFPYQSGILPIPKRLGATKQGITHCRDHAGKSSVRATHTNYKQSDIRTADYVSVP